MGIFDIIFGGYSEDRKAKDEFTQKVKEAGKAYVIDSGKYISGPFEADAVVTGAVYVNKRGFFFQAIPASKCIVIYVEDIQSIDIINNKRKAIKIEYKNEDKYETLIMELFNAEGCVKELKRAAEEHDFHKQNSSIVNDKSKASSENQGDILATIERLAALRDKGTITEEEFQTKKIELLGRL
jgi:hypothetical protein